MKHWQCCIALLGFEVGTYLKLEKFCFVGTNEQKITVIFTTSYVVSNRENTDQFLLRHLFVFE